MSWAANDQDKLGLALIRRYHIGMRRLTDCSVCRR